MGLFDKFKSDEFKDLAKLAFKRVLLDGENISAFSPFLLTINAKGEDEIFVCSSATNEESQDMAYEMAYDIANQDNTRVQKYAVVFVGNYDPGKDEMCPIIAECGIAQKGQAVLFAKSFKINSDGTLRKVPGVFKVRETEYALNKKKSFAARTMIEGGGDVVGPFARLPLVLTYLVAFEQDSFDGEMPNEIWEIYQNLLMGWSNRKDSIGYLMGAFSLKAVMEKNVLQQMPREGINKDTLKSALHIGNQLLIEGVKAGRFEEEDLKTTMKELIEYANKIANILGSGQAESLTGLFGYLGSMSNDPLSLSAT